MAHTIKNGPATNKNISVKYDGGGNNEKGYFNGDGDGTVYMHK